MPDIKIYKTQDLVLQVKQNYNPAKLNLKKWVDFLEAGYERIQEVSDPEKALNRSRSYWQKMGRSQKWIQQRMMGQEVRNKLTEFPIFP